MSTKSGDVLSRPAQRRSRGEAFTRWTIFCIFLEKTYFNAIGSHFASVQRHLKKLDF